MLLKAKKSKKYNLEDDDEGSDFAIPLNDDFNGHVASNEDEDTPGRFRNTCRHSTIERKRRLHFLTDLNDAHEMPSILMSLLRVCMKASAGKSNSFKLYSVLGSHEPISKPTYNSNNIAYIIYHLSTTYLCYAY